MTFHMLCVWRLGMILQTLFHGVSYKDWDNISIMLLFYVSLVERTFPSLPGYLHDLTQQLSHGWNKLFRLQDNGVWVNELMKFAWKERGIIWIHLPRLTSIRWMARGLVMMTSSNGSVFLVTGHLRGEFNGHRWILHTKASDAELWCFLWSTPE